MKLGQAVATPAQWTAFTKSHCAEMATLDASRTLDVLAALSKTSDFSERCLARPEEGASRPLPSDAL